MTESSRYTVLGGTGFIGSAIVDYLKKKSENVITPDRNDNRIFNENLGTVIYAAGFGNCNSPYAVFSANTNFLAKILEHASFDKIIYLSSTRVYMGQESSNELSNVSILNEDERRLFNLTKLLSEEMCLRSNKNVIIVRPSNVYGMALNSPLFLPSIVRNALKDGHIDMYVSESYSKDYVSVDDVVALIYRISKNNKFNIYNIASGKNTKAKEIADIIKNKTGCSIKWHQAGMDDYFPVTDVSRVKDEYSYVFSNVIDDLTLLIEKMKDNIK